MIIRSVTLVHCCFCVGIVTVVNGIVDGVGSSAANAQHKRHRFDLKICFWLIELIDVMSCYIMVLYVRLCMGTFVWVGLMYV